MKIGALVLFGSMVVASAASAQGVNDAQIAAIVVTANQVDIDAGKLAASMGSTSEVKKFGEQMVKDHTGVSKSAVDLVTRLMVTPEDNPTSQALTKQADANRQKFASLSGETFDKAYIDNEVTYHKAVNDALSTTLIPDAQNAELKSLLQTGLKLFQEHQQHAEHLAQQLH